MFPADFINSYSNMPKVSIIMPAYNAAKYIGNAIESIVNQTFKDWELIIVDDCSADNTVNIIKEYSNRHNNIRLIKRNYNSGGARLPRREAAYAAEGELIMTFDADDFLDRDYIEKMHNRKVATSSDITLGTLYYCNDKGETKDYVIPARDFDTNRVLTGVEATRLLLGRVEISVNGLLVDKDIYIKNISSTNEQYDNLPYVDEIDQRNLLINCNKVSFTDARYYYRQHSESLMHLNDTRRYNILTTLEAIYQFAKSNYSDRAVFDKLDNDFITNLLYCYRDYYLKKHYKSTNSANIENILKNAYDFYRKENMRSTGIKQKLCMNTFCTLKFVSYLYGTYLRIKKYK